MTRPLTKSQRAARKTSVSVSCGDKRVVKDLFNLTPAEQADLQQLLAGRKGIVRAVLSGQSCSGDGSGSRCTERTTSPEQGGSPSAEDRSS